MSALSAATAALSWLRLHWAHLLKGHRLCEGICFLISFPDSENIWKHLQRDTCNFKHTHPLQKKNYLTTLPLHKLSEGPWVTAFSCPIEKVHMLISCNLAAQKFHFSQNSNPCFIAVLGQTTTIPNCTSSSRRSILPMYATRHCGV